MNENQRNEILLSKTKLFLGLMGSIIFVIAGLWILIYNPKITFGRGSNPYIRYGAAIASVLFFGYIAIFLVKKLSDKKPGLIIDNNGLVDNSSSIPAGYIPWSDIVKVNVVEIKGTRILLLIVKNPNDYLNRYSGLKRKAMEMSLSKWGTPVSLSSNGLKCDFDQLKNVFEERLNESKKERLSM